MDKTKIVIEEQEYNNLISIAKNYDDLILTTKGYAYDSLCFRYIAARDAQMRADIAEDRKYGGFKEDKIRCIAERDKMRFFEILNDLIGEHT